MSKPAALGVDWWVSFLGLAKKGCSTNDLCLKGGWNPRVYIYI